MVVYCSVRSMCVNNIDVGQYCESYLCRIIFCTSRSLHSASGSLDLPLLDSHPYNNEMHSNNIKSVESLPSSNASKCRDAQAVIERFILYGVYVKWRDLAIMQLS